MKPLALALATMLALAAPALAAGTPADVGILEARLSSNYVMATVQNLSRRDIDSFTVRFLVFSRDRRFIETVEAPFIGTLRPGATASIKGPIYRSVQPGPPVISFGEVTFFLKNK